MVYRCILEDASDEEKPFFSTSLCDCSDVMTEEENRAEGLLSSGKGYRISLKTEVVSWVGLTQRRRAIFSV